MDHRESPQIETYSTLSVFSGNFISKPEGDVSKTKGACASEQEGGGSQSSESVTG